jgi:hypothetical protein
VSKAPEGVDDGDEESSDIEDDEDIEEVDTCGF